MCLVVHQHRLLRGIRGAELAALGRVGDRDMQGELAGPDRGAVQGDPALDQGAEHREEPAAGRLDGGGVGAVGCDVAVPVQQVGAGDAHLVEGQASIVDAVQPTLLAVVLARDAGQQLPGRVADRDVEAVHAVVHAVRDQACEQRRCLRVDRGIAQEVLPGSAEGGVDHPFPIGPAGGVEGGGGRQRLHVGAVADLGHREGAGGGQVHRIGHPGVLLLLTAQLDDRRGVQAPLHSGLDLQGRVGDDQLLEGGDVASVVVGAAEVLGQHPAGDVVLHEELELLVDALAVLGDGGVERSVQLGAGGALTGLEAGVGPLAQQGLGDLRDVEPGAPAGRDRDGSGGIGGGRHVGDLRGGGGRGGGCGAGIGGHACSPFMSQVTRWVTS